MYIYIYRERERERREREVGPRMFMYHEVVQLQPYDSASCFFIKINPDDGDCEHQLILYI